MGQELFERIKIEKITCPHRVCNQNIKIIAKCP